MGSRRSAWAAVAIAAPAIAAALVAACNLVVGLDGFQFPDAGAPKCAHDTDCDDDNPCTTDTCTSTGTCEHTPIPDGPAPASAQTEGDCKQVVCKEGVPSTMDDSMDPPATPDDCVIGACDAGVPLTTQADSGTPCVMGEDGGAAGTCYSGTCVVMCSASAPCATPNACVTASCDTSQGICVFTNLPDGTLVPGAPQTPGTCTGTLCESGKPTLGAVDLANTPDAGSDCLLALCSDAGVPSTPPEPTDQPCHTYMADQAGVCNDAGSCVQCNETLQCAGTGVTSLCQKPACTNNACAQSYMAVGTVCVAVTCAGTMLISAKTCDGIGNCDQGGTSAPCSGGFACNAGGTACRTACAGSDANCASGYYCKTSSCTAQGATGAMCAAYDQCKSGYCAASLCAACTATSQCTGGATCTMGVCM